MGVLSTKVVAGVLATTVVAGGVMWNGGAVVDTAKSTLVDMQKKINSYESNENSLFAKIGLIKADATEKLTDANGKIVSAKEEINNLTANKKKLEDEIKVLEAEVTKLNGDLTAAKNTITEKQAALDAKIAELAEVNTQLTALEGKYNDLVAEYNALVEVSEKNATEAQRANAELDKANEDIAELETTLEEVQADVANDKPMTQEEIDEIGTVNQPDVFSSELAVKNLNLTYIQDGQSESFKAAHPDLEINEGDRVWRVTNANKFDVYVEYSFAGSSEKHTLVAKPQQTFYMTESGGTMIIKWQDENGVWKSATKAGA